MTLNQNIYSGLFLGATMILAVTALVEIVHVVRACSRKVDDGLITSWRDITSSLLDWLRIIVAYGERGWLVQYVGVLMLHLGVLFEVIAHIPHILALLSFSPRPLQPICKPLAVIGLFIGVVGFLSTISFMLVYREIPSKTTFINRIIVGLVFIVAYFEFLMGVSGIYHPLVALIALLVLAFTRCRHFVLSAWLRPILIISNLLANKSKKQS
ncbi:MAG TPA: hypothetical protein EYP08_03755 [Pyrodictiaceae archaeon]|nr:hypothetical protein [Pyrodictiaceae archaeon]